MTGLLQINERDTDDFDIWYKYDIEYIEETVSIVEANPKKFKIYQCDN